MHVVAMLLVLLQQKIIDRNDPQKDLYNKSVKACEQALKLIKTDPEAALQKLNEIHERLKPADKRGLEHYEKLIQFEIMAGDYTKPVAFYPFQYRGLARLKLAALAKEVEDQRRLLAEAAADFQKSLDRGVRASEEFLRQSREELEKLPPPPPPAPTPEELAAAWSREWGALRPKLAFATFKPGEAARAGTAGRLFKRMAAEASLRDQLEAAQWVASETDLVRKGVKTFLRDEARRAVAWCDTLASAAAGVDAFQAPRESLALIRAEAARIADYRGSFTLKIGPAPYAEKVRVLREGSDVPVPESSTPLVLADLEIGDFTVELSHPEAGKRTVPIPAAMLKEGGTYVLSGRMKGGELVVTPLP
jgi:hypothetical protein